MTRSFRVLSRAALAGLMAAAVAFGPSGPARAVEDDPPTAAKKDPEAARQARIEEYLRKKEEKRLQRERERAAKEAAAQAQAEERARLAAEEEALAAQRRAEEEAAKAQQEAETEQLAAAPAPPSPSRIPKSLQQAQENVRRSALGQDPTVQGYLDLVDRQAASAYQLAALGNFIAEAGLRAEALQYYQVAVRMERNDPLLWTNLGTLHRQNGDPKSAAGAYSRALSLDRNNAIAHYNLGAAYDAMGKYDDAIEEYKVALILDPTLGDPSINPQAANNERLMSVKLLVYQQQMGSAGLPLSKVPGGELPPPPSEE